MRTTPFVPTVLSLALAVAISSTYAQEVPLNIVKQKDHFYHVFLEGEYWFDYIKSIGYESKAKFYTKTGIPKLDPFFWDENESIFDNKKLIKEIGIDHKKKTVLFAPSYKPSCIEFLKENLVDLLPKYNLVIKLHPYSWGGKYVSHSQHKYYEDLARDNEEVYLIEENDYDIYPYLFLADTMISDTSSVINEFLALGKFGIIYILPYENLNHSDGMPVLSIDPEDWLTGAFPHMYKPDELLRSVDKALNPTVEMRKELEKYKNYFFTGLDGNASKRVKIEIDKILSL